jgi:hypothetical protein
MGSIMLLLQTLIQDIKALPSYSKEVERFKKDAVSHIRLDRGAQLKLYLLYDIDERKFVKRSEFDAYYNQIVLWEATVPPKREKDKQVEIKEYEYN